MHIRKGDGLISVIFSMLDAYLGRITMVRPLMILVMIFSIQSVDASNSMSEQREALNIISEFAANLCNDLDLAGRGDEYQLSGDVSARLNGLLNKLANIGVGAQGEYQRKEYEGLLRSDLLEALKSNTSCRLKVFQDLSDKLITASETSSLQKKKSNIAGHDLVGKWQQHVAHVPTGGWLSGGIYRVSISDGQLEMSIVEDWSAPEGANHSRGLLDVEYDGVHWTFKSRWASGIGVFKLRRINQNVYEGYSYINGKPIDKNRWTRVQ